MYVSDAMRAVRLLLTAPSDLRTVDLATGRPLTLTGLVQAAARAFDLEPEIRYEGEVPECINFWSVDPYMGEQLGFHAEVPLEDGLRRLCEHLGSN
jgi:nucleoside-diphosphate-sugar epimerase